VTDISAISKHLHGGKALGGDFDERLGGGAGHPQLQQLVEAGCTGAGIRTTLEVPRRVLHADLSQQAQAPLREGRHGLEAKMGNGKGKGMRRTVREKVEVLCKVLHADPFQQAQASLELGCYVRMRSEGK
jgi:hypothetical protein